MIEGRSLGLVIPAHNEERGIPEVLERVPGSIDRILVVDNCSTDRTAEVARDLGADVIEEREKGYGSAYMTGLGAMDTDIVSTADADGTYPVDRIPDLATILIEDGLDFISARRAPGDQARNLDNMLRFGGNAVLTFFTVALFFRWIRDSQSGMWVFRRDVLSSLELTSRGMPFSEEIKIEAWRAPGVRCREVGVPFSYSTRVGSAKLRLWRDGVRNLLFLFAKRLRIPMRGA